MNMPNGPELGEQLRGIDRTEDFIINTARTLADKNHLTKVFFDIDQGFVLELLLMMGEKDAHSYIGKKKDKIDVYIKSKMPWAKFRSHLKKADSCRRLFESWLRSSFIKNGILSKDEIEKLGKDLDIEQEFESCIGLIDKFAEKGDLWRIYLTVACILGSERYEGLLSQSECADFMSSLDQLPRDYVEGTVVRIKQRFSEGLYIPKYRLEQLKRSYRNLAKRYRNAAGGLEGLDLIPTEDIWAATQGLRDKFQKLKVMVLEACERCQGLEIGEKEPCETLSRVEELIGEIEKFKEDSASALADRAEGVLDKAGQLHLNGKQDDPFLNSLLKRIQHTRTLLRLHPNLVEEIVSGKHPVAMLVGIVEGKKELDKYVIGQLLISLSAYCGPEACNALVSQLMVDGLTIGAEEIPQAAVEEASKEDEAAPVAEPVTDEELDVVGGKAPHEEPQTGQEAENAAGEESTGTTGKVINTSIGELLPPAKAASAASGSEEPSRWAELFWALVYQDDIPGAYWLAISLPAVGGEAPVPPWLLEAVQGSRWLTGRTKTFTDDLLGIARVFQPSGDDVETIMGLAASLRPNLLEPGTGLIGWLRVPARFPSFRKLADAVRNYAKLGVALAPEDMTGVAGVESLRKRIELAAGDVRRWLDEAQKRRAKIRIATDIWRHFTGAKGALREMLSPVAEDDESKLASVETFLSNWTRPEYVGEQIDRADEALSKLRARKIVGPVRQHLVRGIEEACSLARNWCELNKRHKEFELRGDWLFDQVAQLRRSIEEGIPEAVQACRELTSLSQTAPIAAATACLSRSLAQILSELGFGDQAVHLLNTGNHSTEWMTIDASTLKVALARRLILIPSIELTDDCLLPEEAFPRVAEPLCKSIAEGLDEKTLHELLIKNQDYRFVEILERCFDEKEKLSLNKSYNAALDCSKTNINDDISSTANHVEQALVDGIVADEKYSEYNEAIEKIRFSENLNYRLKYNQLWQIREKISEEREHRIEELKKTWEALQASLDQSRLHADKKDLLLSSVSELFSRKDTRVLEELLARFREVLDGGRDAEDLFIEKKDVPDDLIDFGRLAPQIEKWIESAQGLATVVDEIERGTTRAQIKFGALPGPRRKEAAQAANNWRLLKQQKPGGKDQDHYIAMVFHFLGFNLEFTKGNPVRLQKEGVDWLLANVTMSAGELAKPIPHFGSYTHNSYDVVCLWERPGADTIAARLKELRLNLENVLVLYFGRLTERQRRDLLRSSRERGLACALLDETLLLFLARERDASNRLPSFFRCALPYSSINPYTPFRAGDVPPEMFFGREDMVKELQRMGGSCIVYGGRQLGKSALLRRVQREYHNPEREQYASVVDIKLLGDPKSMQSPQNIWLRVREALKEFGLINKRITTENQEEIRKYLRNLIDSQQKRSIILLFDEADNFLEANAREGFVEVEALRTLMLESGYRFKVVFAGLHNVQRFQGIPNQPLAHFGKPICVGPLEPDGAQRLVREPLETLGYRFKDENAAVLRILSYTNYHPGLIQLFCQELLKKLHMRTGDFSPPFQITQDDVEAVYLMQEEVRNRIRERFDWTLALHAHYQAIAWLLILDQMEQKDSYARAYPPGDILKLTKDWWPDGFGDVSIDRLRGTLEEMCGLGVLVRNADGHFRLRSPNLVRLMGTDKDIEDNLEELMEKKPTLPFDADSHHVPLDDKARRYSPLTYFQERSLNIQKTGIGLVFCSEALGLSAMSASFKKFVQPAASSAGEGFCEISSDVQNSEQFISRLEAFAEMQSKQEKLVMLFRISTGIEEGLDKVVQNAQMFCDRYKSKKRWLRIILLFDSAMTWRWLSLDRNLRQGLEDKSDSLVYPRKWNLTGINQRLAQHDKIHTDEVCKKVFDTTGGWPLLLDSLFDRSVATDDVRLYTGMLETELLDPAGTLKDSFLWSVGVKGIKAAECVLDLLGDFGEESVPVDMISPEYVRSEFPLTLEECETALEFLIRMNCLDTYADCVVFDPLLRKLLK